MTIAGPTAADDVFNHTIAIGRFHSECTACGANAFPDEDTQCRECGAVFMFMGTTYLSGEPLRELGDRFTEQFPGKMFIGLLTSSAGYWRRADQTQAGQST